MTNIPFKTQPREKQLVALDRSDGHDAFGYFMEMRTGKTKVSLDDAARAALDGRIDTLVVIAPNGVHRQWVDDAIPEHMCLPTVAACYRASARVAEQRRFEQVLSARTDDVKVLTFNIESATNKRGQDFLRQAIKNHRCMVVVDESDLIKTFGAKCTKFLLAASRHPSVIIRRVLTGTPITQSPLDLYSQFAFLDPNILGYSTYTAFKSRHAVIKRILKGQAIAKLNSFAARTGIQYERLEDVPYNILRRAGITLGRDGFDSIVDYKNVDELERKVAGHCYRLRASECNDLPTLVPVPVYVELTREQERIYNELMDKAVAMLAPPPVETDDVLQWYLDNDRVEASNALSKLLRAQQVLGGHVPDVDGNVRSIKHNRLKALMDFLPQVQGKGIIWARFKPELREIAAALREEYGRDAVAEFHGDIGEDQREVYKQAFQNDPRVLWLVGQVQAGGVGQTFDAADTVIFYSNSFSARFRWQAEVRASAVGKESIAVVDLVAPDTVDIKIQKALATCREQAEDFEYG